AETSLFDQETLDLVCKRRALGRAQHGGATDTSDVPDAVGELVARPCEREYAVVEQARRPHTPDLRELFVERHARGQVNHPLIELAHSPSKSNWRTGHWRPRNHASIRRQPSCAASGR